MFESAGGKVHICTKLGVQACAFFIQAENRAIRDKTEFAKSRVFFQSGVYYSNRFHGLDSNDEFV